MLEFFALKKATTNAFRENKYSVGICQVWTDSSFFSYLCLYQSQEKHSWTKVTGNPTDCNLNRYYKSDGDKKNAEELFQ